MHACLRRPQLLRHFLLLEAGKVEALLRWRARVGLSKTIWYQTTVVAAVGSSSGR